MPKMDGLTVMEQVNQDHFVNKRPYFIVITAVGQEKITEDASIRSKLLRDETVQQQYAFGTHKIRKKNVQKFRK